MIPELREYVLVAQDRRHVEVFTRSDSNRWTLTDMGGKQEGIELISIGCSLLLSDIYSKVDLEEE